MRPWFTMKDEEPARPVAIQSHDELHAVNSLDLGKADYMDCIWLVMPNTQVQPILWPMRLSMERADH